MNPARREVGRGSRDNKQFDSSTRVRQTSLEDYRDELATSARGHGLTTSAGADPDWTAKALELIWQLPAGARISADDIREDLGRSPAMGAVFRRVRKAGWIYCDGLTESRVVTRRKGAQRTWVRT